MSTPVTPPNCKEVTCPQGLDPIYDCSTCLDQTRAPPDCTSCNRPWYQLCGDACVDFESDSNNCGACENQCAEGKMCKDGTCQCNPGSFLNANNECQSCDGNCFRPECACGKNQRCDDFSTCSSDDDRCDIEKPTYTCQGCTGTDCRHGCTCNKSMGLTCQYSTEPWSSWPIKRLSTEDKKNCVCKSGFKWDDSFQKCVACEPDQCQLTSDGQFTDRGRDNCGMCKDGLECDVVNLRCSDTMCRNDAQCQARDKGYCVMEHGGGDQYTCNPEYCNPNPGGKGGKKCLDTQICAYQSTNSKIIPFRCSDTYCQNDEDCVKHGFTNRKCDMSPLHFSPEYNTCVENYCNTDQDCDIGKCANYRCNKNCITTNPPLTMGMYPVPMKISNTAYAHAPQEMYSFFTEQPYVGVWGFIQTSGHQVFAQGIMRKYVGVENDAGYRNSELYYEIEDERWRNQFSMFNNPQGLAVCKTATEEGKYRRPIIFVADTGNHCIRMINVTINWNGQGTYNAGQTLLTSTLTGSNWGEAKASYQYPYIGTNLSSKSGFMDGNLDVALFDGPTGLDFDNKGVLYVADTGNNKLRKIVIDQADINIANKNLYPFTNITGTVSTLDVGDLNAPRGVLFHMGKLYVSDNSTIRVLDLAPTVPTVTIIARGLNKPYGLAFSGNNLLFSDEQGVKILVNGGSDAARPVPAANFEGKKPLALMAYEGNIVVGLKDATAVQISGKNCTCFPHITNNCT